MSGIGRTPVIQPAILKAIKGSPDGLDLQMLNRRLASSCDAEQIQRACRYLLRAGALVRVGGHHCYRYFAAGVDMERAAKLVEALLVQRIEKKRAAHRKARDLVNAARRGDAAKIGPRRPRGTNQWAAAREAAEAFVAAVEKNPGATYAELAVVNGGCPKRQRGFANRLAAQCLVYTLPGIGKHCAHVFPGSMSLDAARAQLEAMYAEARVIQAAKDKAARAKAERNRNERNRARTVAKVSINAIADKFRGTATPKQPVFAGKVTVTGWETAKRTVAPRPLGRFEVDPSTLSGLSKLPFGSYTVKASPWVGGAQR